MPNNNAGITSLGGFAFQILVFIAKLGKIEKNQIFEYEVEDDISSKNCPITLDKIEECKGVLKTNNEYEYYQVKRTNVSETKAKKTLYTWLLTEKPGKYFLIVANGYTINDSFITSKLVKEIYDNLDDSKSGNSLEKQVYIKYKKNNDFKSFEKKITEIRNNYNLEAKYIPEDHINENYERILHRTQVNESIYFQRLNSFRNQIELDILQKAYESKAYSINYEQFINYIDEFCSLTTSKDFKCNYNTYKNKITLDDSTKKRREYIQLSKCELSENRIISYLENELYYEDFKNYNIENNNLIKINNIEEEAYQNFVEAKDEEENDTPRKLLKATTQKFISNTNDKMQSNGTYIKLTSDENKKISWSD